MPGGQCVSWHHIPARGFTALLYANHKHLLVLDSGQGSTRVFRCPGTGRAEVVAGWADSAVAVAAHRKGLAYLSANGDLVFRDHVEGNRDLPRLHLAGEVAAAGMAHALAVSDPGSGRIAVAYLSKSRAFQLALAERRYLRDPADVSRVQLDQRVTGIAMHGRDHIITADSSFVRRWQADGPGRLRQVAAGSLPRAHDLVVTGDRAEVCALDQSGAVVYLDALSLKPVDEPREFTERRGTAMWSAADNSCYALAGDRVVDVATRELLALRRLADQPAAAWQPADLSTVTQAQALLAWCPAARPLHTVLTGWLEHKFAGDVRLGRVPAARWADDDIAIGAPVEDAEDALA
jgi:hypothetical protein